jgi:anti-sigma factor RsiW
VTNVCDERRMIPAYLDGQLVGEERAAFEAHCRRCEGCTRELGVQRILFEAIRRGFPRDGAPPELRARIEAILRRPRRRRRVWLALAAAAVAVAVAGVMVLARREEGRGPSRFGALAAETHLRYTRGQLPLEVDSGQPEAVTRWFEGRVPFHLTLPDYPVAAGERKPYRLMGGRLVGFRDDYAAFVAYRMEESGRPISLLVTSSSAVLPSGGEVIPFGSLTFHQEAVSGLDVITWTDKGLTYALAADVTVGGRNSCLVCHGSPEERRRLEGFATPGT